MRPGRRIRHLALRAASSRRLHDLEARARLAITSAIQHIHRTRRPPLFSSRWKYTRLPFPTYKSLVGRERTDVQVENDTIIRLKPRSVFVTTLRSTLRSARRVLRLTFLQAKYLIPMDAEAAGVWIM